MPKCELFEQHEKISSICHTMQKLLIHMISRKKNRCMRKKEIFFSFLKKYFVKSTILSIFSKNFAFTKYLSKKFWSKIPQFLYFTCAIIIHFFTKAKRKIGLTEMYSWMLVKNCRIHVYNSLLFLQKKTVKPMPAFRKKFSQLRTKMFQKFPSTLVE